MIRTTIHHGHLHIELCEDGSLQVVNESNGGTLRISQTEWYYLQAVAKLHGWPVAPCPEMLASIPNAVGDTGAVAPF
jgi:hypothetical protein